MTFEQWLKKQIKRNDPIGDLSTDYFGALALQEDKKEKCNELHLNKWFACKGAYDALKEARKEYKASKVNLNMIENVRK